MSKQISAEDFDFLFESFADSLRDEGTYTKERVIEIAIAEFGIYFKREKIEWSVEDYWEETFGENTPHEETADIIMNKLFEVV